jgi:ABC-type multidrug transport system ATPase subunit
MVEQGPPVAVKGLVVAHHSRAYSGAPGGVNLDIGPGTMTALVGPNGAGKSTLLHALSGFGRHPAGHVTVSGMTARKYRLRHGVGYLPEDLTPSPGWTVAEWVETSALVRGSTRRRAAGEVAALLSQLDLTGRTGERVDRLSRGTMRRAALAFALAGHPTLVMLDEPLSGLDPRASSLVREVVLRLQARGATVVVTAHDALATPSPPDHTIFLDHGQISGRLDGDADESVEERRPDPPDTP